MPLVKPRRKKYVEIYLINDNTTTFQHVIESLSATIPRCSVLRAEQIALITHNTGACHIYTGRSNIAAMVQSSLISRKLKILTKFK